MTTPKDLDWSDVERDAQNMKDEYLQERLKTKGEWPCDQCECWYQMADLAAVRFTTEGPSQYDTSAEYVLCRECVVKAADAGETFYTVEHEETP